MLAQNFKTPADLEITDAEFDALQKVLGMLERGEIPHAKDSQKQKGDSFNMTSYLKVRPCGTVACICGWAYLVSEGRAFPEAAPDCTTSPARDNHALRELFMANRNPPLDATPAQAAIALRNYLTHGEPRWAEAIAD